jgi:hypothetical protein
MSKGFSILQILVASALLAGLGLMLNQILGNASKGQKNVQNSVDFDLLRSSLNLVFNTRACDGAFFKTGSPLTLSFPATLSPGTNLVGPGSAIDIDEIRMGNSVIAKRNSALPGGMRLDTLALSEAIYDGNQVVDGVGYRAFMSLVKVRATKAQGSYGAQFLETQVAVRILARTTDGVVAKCASAADSTPTGMVAAFNLASCPSGWTAVPNAAGRFVVGTGTLAPDTYALGSTGGSARHTLTLAELPAHDHATSWRTAGAGFALGPYGPPAEVGASQRTTSTGGGQPHENRPPYLALLYCQKD